MECADGSRHAEALVRDSDWLDEPGGAEFVDPRHCVFDAVAVADAA